MKNLLHVLDSEGSTVNLNTREPSCLFTQPLTQKFIIKRYVQRPVAMLYNAPDPTKFTVGYLNFKYEC